MPTVSEHVAHALAPHCSHAFGVMGNGNAYFLDALERHRLVPFTSMRHEAGGVVAADVYHRVSGGLAIATATYGAGFTNTLTGLAEAVRAGIPLVLVVGDAPTTGARAWDVDQVAAAEAMGAPTYTVGGAEPIVDTVGRAVRRATDDRLPVVLAIPYDLASAEGGPLPEHPPLPASPHPPAPQAAEGLLDALASALASARRPFLLAGRGAWTAGATPALNAIADAVGAVTASTALARGAFARDEFDLGVAGGFGAEAAMGIVRESDVAVVFGASLNPFTMRFGELFAPGTKVFRVDSTPGEAPNDGVFVLGDAAQVASAVLERLRERDAASSGWRESIDAVSLRAHDPGATVAADGRLDPRTVAARLAELLPRDRVVVSDGGHFLGWANMYWPIAGPDRMVMAGTAFQSIGLGLPSVAGAARAKPDATIVLTSGDGGALMALADLESAVRVAGGRGLAIIWNDAAYSAEVIVYGSKGLLPTPMLIPETDFAALARAAGAEGVVVRELGDLERLAEWARTPPSDRPFLLLDLRVSNTVVAPYQQEIVRVTS